MTSFVSSITISSKFNKQRYYKKIRIVDRKMLNCSKYSHKVTKLSS